MHRIEDTLTQVQNQINSAAKAHNKNSNDITLLAVSKKHTAEKIREVYTLGLRHFGENYIQEAQEKQAELAALEITWHFIGPIQSNKTRAIAEHFDWVHSVDRLKIAKRLSEQRNAYIAANHSVDKKGEIKPLNICLQVNIDEQESKSGVMPSDAVETALSIAKLPMLALRGLMFIPAPSSDYAQQRATFSRAQALYKELQQHCPDMDTLSMGMSGDLEAAIAEGATIVRIGTALFGAREA